MWDRAGSDGLRSYECGTCSDNRKIARRCRYSLSGDAPAGYGEGRIACPAYGFDSFTGNALKFFGLFEKGQIRLDDLDGRYYEAVEAIQHARVVALDLVSNDEAKQVWHRRLIAEVNDAH